MTTDRGDRSRIRVERSKHSSRIDGRRNWLVIDNRGPKAFTRVFVFSMWWVAVREAQRLATTGLIDPYGLMATEKRR